MKWGRFVFITALFASAQGFAQELPAPLQTTDSELISAKKLTISATEQNKLKTRLKAAVFRVYAKQPAMHDLIQNGFAFDGAAVAVTPETVKDVVKNKDEITEMPANTQDSKPNSSMFGRGLDRASSPFATKSDAKSEWKSERQFFLTTADWITNSQTIEIDIFGQKIPARIDYRDDAQNLAVLSTPGNPKIEPADVYPADNPIPSVVFVLLSPNEMYESLTTHILNVTQEHLYGTTNLTARNGYPMFTSDGKVAGLVVSPDASHKTANVVHTRIIDRALHPEKYNRTTVEEVEIKEY